MTIILFFPTKNSQSSNTLNSDRGEIFNVRPHKSSQFSHAAQIATDFPLVGPGTIPTRKMETEVLQDPFQAQNYFPETTFNWCCDRSCMAMVKHKSQLLPSIVRIMNCPLFSKLGHGPFPGVCNAWLLFHLQHRLLVCPRKFTSSRGQWENHRLSFSTSKQHSRDKPREERSALQLQ